MFRSLNSNDSMKTNHYLLTFAAVLSCGASTLLAQDAPPPPPGNEGKPPGEGRPPGPPPQGGGGPHDRLAEFIKRADTDNDGKISKDEFLASTKKESEDRFSKLDANSDGFADKSEIEEAGRKMREMAQRRPEGEGPGGFRRPDGEGSRRPEGDGFRRPEGDGPRPRPGQGDSQNGNPPPPGDGGFRRPEGGEGRRGPGGDGGRGMGMLGDMLQRMDKDNDGTLTKEEFLSSSEERFAQMDENKDGKVTKEEIEAMGRRMREMMGGGGRGPGGEGGQGGFRRPDGDKPKGPDGQPPAPPKE